MSSKTSGTVYLFLIVAIVGAIALLASSEWKSQDFEDIDKLILMLDYYGYYYYIDFNKQAGHGGSLNKTDVYTDYDHNYYHAYTDYYHSVQQEVARLLNDSDQAEEVAATSTTLARASKQSGSFFGVDWGPVKDLDEWLIKMEIQYGGRVSRVPCFGSDVVDPPDEIKGKKVCSGGDRMKSEVHTYGLCYAHVVDAMKDVWQKAWTTSPEKEFHAAEIGVLKGSGVAIWSDLFAHATIHAFDRFSANIVNNTPFMVSRGAFSNGMYKAHAFDQAALTHKEADAVLDGLGNKLFWIIDDASHRVDYTVRTFRYFARYLDEEGVYIIEDAHHYDEYLIRRGLGPDFAVWQCKHDLFFYVITHMSFYEVAKAAFEVDSNFRYVPLRGGKSSNHISTPTLPLQNEFLSIHWSNVVTLLRWLQDKEQHYSHSTKTMQEFGMCYGMLFDTFGHTWKSAARLSKYSIAQLGTAADAPMMALWADLFIGVKQLHLFVESSGDLEASVSRLRQKRGAFNHSQPLVHSMGEDGDDPYAQVTASQQRMDSQLVMVVDTFSKSAEAMLKAYSVFENRMYGNGLYIYQGVEDAEALTLRSKLSASVDVLHCEWGRGFYVLARANSTTLRYKHKSLHDPGDFIWLPAPAQG